MPGGQRAIQSKTQDRTGCLATQRLPIALQSVQDGAQHRETLWNLGIQPGPLYAEITLRMWCTGDRLTPIRRARCQHSASPWRETVSRDFGDPKYELGQTGDS